MTGPRPPEATVVRRRRVQLAAIALVFLGPLVLAFGLYYGGAWLPRARVNRGTLIEPARPLPAASLPTPAGTPTGPDFLRGKWSLVLIVGEHCDARCRATLEELRRVRLALERDGSRVRRVLLGQPGCCAEGEVGPPAADLTVAWLDEGAGTALAARFAADGAPLADGGRVWLVDPLGNLMLTYAPGSDLKDLLKDLEKLLRLSHIG